jgi:hypothetical protein
MLAGKVGAGVPARHSDFTLAVAKRFIRFESRLSEGH